jgi:hypothetical protein
MAEPRGSLAMRSFHQIAFHVSCAALLVGCATTSSQPPATWDGLDYRPSRESGALYVRAGAESKAYRTVMIDPLAVAIAKDGFPVFETSERPGIGARELSSSEIRHIQEEIAREFHAIFVDELTAGGYQVVERPSGDTVRVSPGLANVNMQTPDRSLAKSSRADSMTLVAELRDAATGQLIARLVDEKTGAMGVLQFPNSVTNNVNFRRAVRAWAQRVRAYLDEMGRQPA